MNQIVIIGSTRFITARAKRMLCGWDNHPCIPEGAEVVAVVKKGNKWIEAWYQNKRYEVIADDLDEQQQNGEWTPLEHLTPSEN